MRRRIETPIKKPTKPKGQSKEDALDNKKPVSDCGRSKTATQKKPTKPKGAAEGRKNRCKSKTHDATKDSGKNNH
jgi:hypothetical protein